MKANITDEDVIIYIRSFLLFVLKKTLTTVTIATQHRSWEKVWKGGSDLMRFKLNLHSKFTMLAL